MTFMELKDFIKATISEITAGILVAQKETKDTGVIINPSYLAFDSKGEKYLRPGGMRYVQDIEINVAIAVSRTDGEKVGLNVIAGLYSTGNLDSIDVNNNCVSTIKFKIPVALPITDIPNKHIGDLTVF
jgi:hypothetical protein